MGTRNFLIVITETDGTAVVAHCSLETKNFLMLSLGRPMLAGVAPRKTSDVRRVILIVTFVKISFAAPRAGTVDRSLLLPELAGLLI